MDKNSFGEIIRLIKRKIRIKNKVLFYNVKQLVYIYGQIETQFIFTHVQKVYKGIGKFYRYLKPLIENRIRSINIRYKRKKND